MSQCGHANCTKRPTYGVPGTKKREYCSQHAKEGMINVNNKRCIQPNCTTIPSFALVGSKKAEYCSQHAREGMIDVRSKRCSQRGHNTQISPGKGGQSSTTPGSCSEHSGEGMVGLRNKRCGRRGCTLRPLYIPGQGNKKAEFCSKHANDAILSRFGEFGGGGGAGIADDAATAGAKRKQPPPISPYELSMADVSSGVASGLALSGDLHDDKRLAMPTTPVTAMQFPLQPNDRYGGDSLEFRPLSTLSDDRYLGAESLAHFRSPPNERFIMGGMNSLHLQPQPICDGRYNLGGVTSQFRPQSNPNDRYGDASLTAGEEGSAYSEEMAGVFDKELPL